MTGGGPLLIDSGTPAICRTRPPSFRDTPTPTPTARPQRESGCRGALLDLGTTEEAGPRRGPVRLRPAAFVPALLRLTYVGPEAAAAASRAEEMLRDDDDVDHVAGYPVGDTGVVAAAFCLDPEVVTARGKLFAQWGERSYDVDGHAAVVPATLVED